MEKEKNIWVFGDHRNHPRDRLTMQVIAQARRLCGDSGTVTVLLLGNHLEEFVKEYIAHGAHRILLADHPGLTFHQADVFATILCDLIRDRKPDAFLLGASDFGREVAARVAKRIGTGLGADCVSFEWDREKHGLIGFSPAFGGAFLFGGIFVVQYLLQPLGISPNLLAMAPYLFTLVVLVALGAWKGRRHLAAPAALGETYTRGER